LSENARARFSGGFRIPPEKRLEAAGDISGAFSPFARAKYPYLNFCKTDEISLDIFANLSIIILAF
jgi:hypothetical protein